MKAIYRSRAARRSLSSVLAFAMLATAVMIAPTASVGLPVINDDIMFAYPTVSGATLSDAITGFTPPTHRVHSVTLFAGDTITLAGAYAGDPFAVASIRLFGPDATSVHGDQPIAVAAEGTTTVQYTATIDETYYIDVQYSCSAAIGYQFSVVVNEGSGGGGGFTPEVTFEPDRAAFDAVSGERPPASQTVTVTIAGAFPSVGWYLYDIPEWLTITPSEGMAPGVTAMEISVDITSLDPGDYSVDVQVGVKAPSFPSSFSRSSTVGESYGTLPVALTVTEEGFVKLDSAIAGFGVSPSYPTRASSAVPKTVVSGGVRAVGGVVETETVLGGQPVDIFRSYDNVSFAKIATALTDVRGNFSYQAAVLKKTYFKAVFAGNDALNASRETTVKYCVPYAYLTTPTTPGTVYKARTFATYGYVYPSHSSTYPVKLYFYRYERLSSGKYAYVYRKAAYGKRIAVSSVSAKYSTSTSVPSAGKWRVRAVHTDTDHKTSYSAYRYFYAR